METSASSACTTCGLSKTKVFYFAKRTSHQGVYAPPKWSYTVHTEKGKTVYYKCEWVKSGDSLKTIGGNTYTDSSNSTEYRIHLKIEEVPSSNSSIATDDSYAIEQDEIAKKEARQSNLKWQETLKLK